MTAPTAPKSTAVTAPAPEKKLSPAAAEAKARREIVQSIKGTQWGKDCSPDVAYAVARWSLDNGVDAVRHVEVLGGRIYLNGDFYLEKAAPLVLAGDLAYEEPRFVHADPGLVAMANRKMEDVPEWEQAQVTWAREEIFRRFQERVERGIPHDATGACVFVVRTKNGTPLVGANWCGGATKVKQGKNGSYRGDPVGDAEPTKTAHTRAARRALRQIIEAFPDSPLAKTASRLEASARVLNAELAPIIDAEREQRQVASAHPAALGAGDYTEQAPVPGFEPIDEAERLASLAAEQARTAEDEEFEKRLAAER